MRLLGKLNMIAARYLPAASYFSLQDFVRPIIQRHLTGSGREVFRTGDGYCVRWADGTEFHFAHAQRYNRYMHPSGLQFIFDLLRNKYQDGDVVVEPGDIVVDVGANIGEFSCAIAPIAGRVLAMEPDPNVQPSLLRNASERTNIVVLPCAAGPVDGELEFYIQTSSADTSAIRPPQWSEKRSIPSRRLSSVINDHNISVVDFLKIEAEGFEPEVLEGAVEMLSSTRKIAIDCSPERNGKTTFRECEKLLTSHGFNTWRKEIPYQMLFAIR